MKRRLLSLFLLISILLLTFTACAPTQANPISLSEIPEYSGSPYIEINGNLPFFEPSDYTTSSYETYSPLDSLGRCGVATACIGLDIMPTEERESSLTSVTPSGWNQVKYEGTYLYHRCHLIGFQLTGENANEKNLITGTGYMNVTGMLPFENMVDDYIEETGNHVLYRVTPIYEGNNLVASGVLMEAYSVEDEGDGITFCVYVYNVQPGITINYKTGESNNDGSEFLPDDGKDGNIGKDENENDSTTESNKTTYILVTSTKKYHESDCTYAKNAKDENKESTTLSKEEIEKQGYSPCGSCKP